MTATEATRILTLLFESLGALGLLALLLYLLRIFLEKRARASIKRHSGSLVGKRAMVLNDLRPGLRGSIRLLGTPDEESERAIRKDAQEDYESFPALAEELISRGRVVRVTGGDEDGYLVRPL